MTQYDQFVAMLESAGYTVDEEADPTELGQLEYTTGIGGGKRILSLGAGRIGDEYHFTNFYFTLDSGEFVEHASTSDDS